MRTRSSMIIDDVLSTVQTFFPFHFAFFFSPDMKNHGNCIIENRARVCRDFIVVVVRTKPNQSVPLTEHAKDFFLLVLFGTFDRLPWNHLGDLTSTDTSASRGQVIDGKLESSRYIALSCTSCFNEKNCRHSN